MTTASLEKKAKEYKQLQIEIDTLTKEQEHLKEQMKAELENRNVDEVITESYVIRHKKIESNRFDSKALKNYDAEVYGLFVKPSVSYRFTIN